MTSTDVAGLQDVDTVSITVTPVDDVPQINNATVPALAENSANGTSSTTLRSVYRHRERS